MDRQLHKIPQRQFKFNGNLQAAEAETGESDIEEKRGEATPTRDHPNSRSRGMTLRPELIPVFVAEELPVRFKYFHIFGLNLDEVTVR